MQFDKYLFRCSELGKLMTEAKSKREALGETTKTYLWDIFIKEKFGRKRDVKSKFLEKGLSVEELSIDTYCICTMEYVEKNEQRFVNDYICGTPDIVSDGCIIDIKSSWDIFNFNRIKREENKDYIWQLQGYMWLTGIENAKLAYCLTDTPDPLIERELKQALYQSGLSQDSEAFLEYAKEMKAQLKYEDMAYHDRIYIKDYVFDPEMIERLKIRIEQCREFLNNANW